MGMFKEYGLQVVMKKCKRGQHRSDTLGRKLADLLNALYDADGYRVFNALYVKFGQSANYSVDQRLLETSAGDLLPGLQTEAPALPILQISRHFMEIHYCCNLMMLHPWLQV